MNSPTSAAGHDRSGSLSLFVRGVLTDELFERWLDDDPARRRAHDGFPPAVRERERARVARVAALRTSPLPGELLLAARLASTLLEQLRRIRRRYAPHEAAKVLEAFGLRVPHPHDVCQAWPADHFAEAHRSAGHAVRFLKEFVDSAWHAVYLLVPDADAVSDPLPLPPTPGGEKGTD